MRTVCRYVTAGREHRIGTEKPKNPWLLKDRSMRIWHRLKTFVPLLPAILLVAEAGAQLPGGPSYGTPALMSMSSRMRSNTGVLLATLMVGDGLQPKQLPRPVVKTTI